MGDQGTGEFAELKSWKIGEFGCNQEVGKLKKSGLVIKRFGIRTIQRLEYREAENKENLKFHSLFKTAPITSIRCFLKFFDQSLLRISFNFSWPFQSGMND